MKQLLYSFGTLFALLTANYNGKAQAQLAIPSSPDRPLLMAPLAGAGELHSKEYKYAELRTWEYHLPNGVRVVVRPDDSAEEVYIRGFSSHGASSLAAPGSALYFSALGAPGYVYAGGLGDYDAAALSRLLGRRKVAMAASIGVEDASIAGHCSLEELETALQWIYLSFKAPRFSPAVFAGYRHGLFAALSARHRDGYTMFRDSVDRITGFADTGLAVLTTRGIDSMQPALAEEAYRRCFGDAASFTFVFTGRLVGSSMNVSRYLRVIETYLGALPGGAGSPAVAGIPGLVGSETGEMAGSGVAGREQGFRMAARGREAAGSLVFTGEYAYSDSANLQLRAEADILQYIFRRLVADAGLPVRDDSVRLALFKGSPARYTLQLDVRYPAADYNRVMAIARAATDSLRRAGDGDVQRYRDAGRRALKVLTFSSRFWTDYLADKYRRGDDPYEIAHFPYNFKKVTAESLRQTAGWSLTEEREMSLLPREMRVAAVAHGRMPSGTGGGLPLDTALRMGRLANGFTYYIRRNTVPEHRVGFFLVNKVGSILESEDQRGLAHFMEHMNFNGTTHFPKNELIDYLQRAGVRFGADVNAYTSFDETVYELPLATDKPGLVKEGLLILRDWAQGATLDPVEIDKERGVVLEEKRLHRGAGQRLSDRYLPMLVNGSRYGDRLPIGIDTVLRYFHAATLRRFHHDWYRPDLQALIVVGDIDADSMERVVRQEFAGLKNPTRERPRTHYSVPLTGKNDFMALADPEVSAISAEIMIQHPAFVVRTAADYRKGLVRQLLLNMLGSRFTRLSSEANPPFVTAGAGVDAGTGGLETFTVATTAKPGLLRQSVEDSWREIVRLQRYGFTATELERAKKIAASRMETTVKESSKTGSGLYIREYMDHFLKGTATPGIVRENALFQEFLPGITIEDVDTLFRQLTGKVNRKILVMAPTAGLPDAATFNGWLAGVEADQVKPYKDEQLKAPLLGEMRAPGKIDSERRVAEVGVTALRLSNGMQVLLKPTNFTNGRISLSLVGPGGMSVYADSDYFSAATSSDVISGGGLGNYDETQLREYMAGKQGGAVPFIAGHSDGFNGGASTADLSQALELIYGYCTAPREDSGWYANYVGRLRSSLLRRDNDPATVFNDTIAGVLSGYDFRARPMHAEDLDKVSLANCLRIFKDRFADASAFTAIFVGSIDTQRIRPLLEKYLASLPSIHNGDRGRDYGIRPPAGPLEKIVCKGKDSTKASVELIFGGTTIFNGQERLALEGLGSVLQIRLIERLREEESGVYTPGVKAELTKIAHSDSGIYRVTVAFTCSPQHVNQLIASTYEEIARLKREGPTDVNLRKFQEQSISAIQPELNNNAFWISYLKEQVRNGAPLDEIDRYETSVRQVDVATLRAAAIRFLGEEHRLLFKLLPER